MRQFWIQDGVGTTYPLNGENGIWLLNPAGLGVSFSNEFGNIKEGFFAPLDKDNNPLQTVTCDFGYVRNSYAAYRTFINNLLRASELYIIYQPYGSEKFFRKVKLDFVTKTELMNAAGWMTTPAQFSCLTPWYKATALTITMEEQATNAMRYPFVYDSDLVYGSSYAGNFVAELNPGGHLPASIVFKFTGTVDAPVLTLEGLVTGNSYGRCEVNKNVASEFEYSSLYTDSYVTVDGADAMDYVSPQHDPFFHVPMTEPVILRLNSLSAITGTAEATMNYYYRSV